MTRSYEDHDRPRRALALAAGTVAGWPRGAALTRRIVALAFAGVALVAGAVPAHAADLSFTGYARAPDSRALLYVESHYVRNAGQPDEKRVVMYRCASGGAAFARKELSYGEVREEPEFSFVDARSGYAEGLRRTPRGPQVYQRESARAAQREAAVPANVVVVSDAGFDEFVRRHWRELEAGRSVRFPFLIPSRLDFMNFKVHKHGEATVDGAVSSVIRLNLSGVLGWFLPYIEVTYRKSDQVLLRYEGLTNIRDAAGKNLVARIEFPDAERRTLAAGAAPLEAQRAAPLVARCPGS